MPDEVVIDTSVWAAVAKGESRADPLAEVQGPRPAVISSLSWAELASLNAQARVRLHRVEAVALDARTEPVEHGDCIVGGRLHGKLRLDGHRKVGLVDCIIYASARRLGVALITLDTDLEGLPGVEVLCKKA